MKVSSAEVFAWCELGQWSSEAPSPPPELALLTTAVKPTKSPHRYRMDRRVALPGIKGLVKIAFEKVPLLSRPGSEVGPTVEQTIALWPWA